MRDGRQQIPTNLGISWHGSEGTIIQFENRKARLEIGVARSSVFVSLCMRTHKAERQRVHKARPCILCVYVC